MLHYLRIHRARRRYTVAMPIIRQVPPLSVNAVYDSAAVAILLSGMGRGGADELALLRKKGAITIA
ncbi:MAG: chemotaxis protein CheB [Halothiobacillus sp.]